MTTGITQVAVIAGEAFYYPYEGIPLTQPGLSTNWPSFPDVAYPVKGRRLVHGIKNVCYAPFVCNPDVAGSTTWTVRIWLALDVNAKNCDLVNTGVRMDAAIGVLTSATSLCDDSALGTAVAATCTMGTAVGVVSTVTCALTSVASVAAGTVNLLRIRRLGTDALDTNLGSVILLGASIIVA